MNSSQSARRWRQRRNRRDAVRVVGWLPFVGLCVVLFVVVAAGWGTP
jgi:hypothetical protein